MKLSAYLIAILVGSAGAVAMILIGLTEEYLPFIPPLVGTGLIVYFPFTVVEEMESNPKRFKPIALAGIAAGMTTLIVVISVAASTDSVSSSLYIGLETSFFALMGLCFGGFLGIATRALGKKSYESAEKKMTSRHPQRPAKNNM
ncbi:MAG: hypothetical protein AAB601_00685, partial [Patescibacteria group bacterium]